MKDNVILKKLRLRFVLTCAVTAGILLIVLFSVLWMINLRNQINEIKIGLDAVLELQGYQITPPKHPSFEDDEVSESRSFYSRAVLFSVSENGAIDYQNILENHPYLEETDDLNDVINATVLAASADRNFYEVNGHFYVASMRAYDQHTDYVFFDWSAERSLILRSGFWFIMAYLFAITSVALIAYLLSDRVLEPVEESISKGKKLIANASHELKTPLTIISANLSVIQSEPESTVKSNEKWFEAIEEQVNRTNGLILDMLELSKMEDVGENIKEPVNLSEVVMAGSLTVEALCYEKSIIIDDQIEENVIINGIKKPLERLTLILLDNAIKYTPYGGNICVKLYRRKKNYVLSVRNTGEGIKEEDLPHVFERFYKGDRARTQGANNNSYGLGLAMAKAIAEHHDAKIDCQSVPNEYTEFKVTFRSKG